MKYTARASLAANTESLALAVSFLQPLMQLLGRGIAAQECGGQFPEGPTRGKRPMVQIS
jgi:hypothetical protein